MAPGRKVRGQGFNEGGVPMLIWPAAKELKRAAAVPQSRTEKFREKIKATQQETIEGWKTHREEM